MVLESSKIDIMAFIPLTIPTSSGPINTAPPKVVGKSGDNYYYPSAMITVIYFNLLETGLTFQTGTITANGFVLVLIAPSSTKLAPMVLFLPSGSRKLTILATPNPSTSRPESSLQSASQTPPCIPGVL
jgi:hypothetical protein